MKTNIIVVILIILYCSNVQIAQSTWPLQTNHAKLHKLDISTPDKVTEEWDHNLNQEDYSSKTSGLLMNYDFSSYSKSKSVNEEGSKAESYKSPWLAFGLSAIFPGLGQFYNGDYLKAIIHPLLFVGGAALAAQTCFDCDGSNQSITGIGLGVAVGAYVWSIIDAPISASNRKSMQSRLSLYSANSAKLSVNLTNSISRQEHSLQIKLNF